MQKYLIPVGIAWVLLAIVVGIVVALQPPSTGMREFLRHKVTPNKVTETQSASTQVQVLTGRSAETAVTVIKKKK